MTEDRKKVVDGVELISQEIHNSFAGFMRSTLVEIESLLPHKQGSGDNNELAFLNLRRKILRLGNDRVRLLADFMKDFEAIKVYESKKVVILNPNLGKGN